MQHMSVIPQTPEWPQSEIKTSLKPVQQKLNVNLVGVEIIAQLLDFISCNCAYLKIDKSSFIFIYMWERIV